MSRFYIPARYYTVQPADNQMKSTVKVAIVILNLAIVWFHLMLQMNKSTFDFHDIFKINESHIPCILGCVG